MQKYPLVYSIYMIQARCVRDASSALADKQSTAATFATIEKGHILIFNYLLFDTVPGS
jgi:hypothetical protein